jgi:hypothetical protein
LATFLLSDLNAVKTALKAEGESDDGVLTLWLRTVSAEAAKIMKRPTGIRQEARVETVNVRRGQRVFPVRGWPIVSIASIEWDPLSSFITPTTLDTNLYTFDPRKGLVYLRLDLNTHFGHIHGGHGSHTDLAPQSLRVTYMGGIATDIEALRADDEYDDIEQAVLLQIHAMWKRRDSTPGDFAISGQGGSTRQPALDWVPQAFKILKRHARRNVA